MPVPSGQLNGNMDAAPVASEHLLALVSPWHKPSSIQPEKTLSVGPLIAGIQEPVHASKSSYQVWSREFSAASIATVPGPFPVCLNAGGGLPSGDMINSSSLMSLSLPQPHALMRSIAVYPQRPPSYDTTCSPMTAAMAEGGVTLDAVFSTNSAAGAFVTTAAAPGDATGMHSTMSSSSTTCVTRLAQLVLSSESTQKQPHLHQQLLHQQQQQQLFGFSQRQHHNCVISDGSVAGGAEGHRSVPYQSIAQPSLGLLGYGVAKATERGVPLAFAATAPGPMQGVMAVGGASLQAHSGAALEVVRGPIRTRSDVSGFAHSNLPWERRGGTGCSVDGVLRSLEGWMHRDHFGQPGCLKQGTSFAGMEAHGDGGGAGCVSAPATSSGQWTAPDVAFSRVRQMQLLRNHNVRP